MRGSIHSEYIAQLLIGLKVEMSFKGWGTFTGEVTGYDAKEDFDNRLLHIVKFTDGDIDEYPYSEIIKAHEEYLNKHCATVPRKSIVLHSTQATTHAPAYFSGDTNPLLPCHPGFVSLIPLASAFGGSDGPRPTKGAPRTSRRPP